MRKRPKSRRFRWFTLVLVCAVLIILVLISRHRFSNVVTCPDGPRRTIDMKDFETKNFAYAVELTAKLRSEVVVGGKISPVKLHELSDALQSANESRKALVAGYNACAIERREFGEYLGSFQALDSLSRQIDAMLDKKSLSAEEQRTLNNLVEESIAVVNKLKR